MARRVQILLIDDVDGEEASETMMFGLDGVVYEIDLSADNAQELRQAVQPWVERARRTGGRRRAAPRSDATPTAESPPLDTQSVRMWARSNGHAVSDRGRVADSVLQAYRDAHGR